MDGKILGHFKKVDPVIFKIIEKIGIIEVTSSGTYFHNLCRSICNQQLSIKSAAAIFGRFKNLFQNQEILPERALNLKDSDLRKAGLSKTKIIYIKDLAQKIIDEEIIFKKFLEMENEEIILELTRVKGIGRWTVEMFLMSSLGREDVFSYGDLGLKKAFQKLYGLEKLPTQKDMEKIVIKWSPYRTYAAKILWKSLVIK